MPTVRPCAELDRPTPRRHIALDTRIDDEVESKNIAEKGLRNRLYIGAVEIHFDARPPLRNAACLQRRRPHLRIAIALAVSGSVTEPGKE